MRLLEILVDGLLNDTLLLFAAIVFSGLMLAKRSAGESLRGAATVLVSWTTLLIGLSVLSQALGWFESLVGVLLDRPAPPTAANVRPLASFDGSYLHAQTLAVLLAYGVNVLWALLTRAKYVFLNPLHVMLGSAALLMPWFLADASPYLAVPVVGVVIGSAMAWLPFLGDRSLPLVRAGEGIGLGSFHTGLLFACIRVARIVGARRQPPPAEEPARAGTAGGSFRGGPILGSGALVGAVFLLLAVNAGDAVTRTVLSLDLFAPLPMVAADQYLVAAALVGCIFAAALYIVVRSAPSIVGVVVKSFEGFRRLVPGLRPAVDAVFILPEAPHAAVVGALLSYAGAIAGSFLFGMVGMNAVVPGMMLAFTAGHFVGGGAAGVIANRVGGRAAVAVVAPLHGLALSFLASFAITLANTDAIELSDVALLAAALGKLAGLVG